MKLRYIALATAALFTIGPVVSHADEGLRRVFQTAFGGQSLTGIGAGQVGFGLVPTGVYADTNNIAIRAPASTGSVYLQGPSGATTYAIATPNGLNLPKLAAAPTTPPGAGFIQIFAIAGTTGTCTLAMQAGTSTTVTNVALNAGAGC